MLQGGYEVCGEIKRFLPRCNALFMSHLSEMCIQQFLPSAVPPEHGRLQTHSSSVSRTSSFQIVGWGFFDDSRWSSNTMNSFGLARKDGAPGRTSSSWTYMGVFLLVILGTGYCGELRWQLREA